MLERRSLGAVDAEMRSLGAGKEPRLSIAPMWQAPGHLLTAWPSVPHHLLPSEGFSGQYELLQLQVAKRLSLGSLAMPNSRDLTVDTWPIIRLPRSQKLW